MPTSPVPTAPTWTKHVLYAAAVYNLAWGAVTIVWPLALFRWAGIDDPKYPEIWQCVGMIVGVYGIGYWLAARDPFHHWPIVFVGLIGKVFGPVGFLNAVITGSLPWTWGATIITNDLIWWIPFASILYLAFRHNTDTSPAIAPISLFDALREPRSHRNATLLEVSAARPTLVVFLRQAGCPFCHETLSQLARKRKQLQQSGFSLAIIHMGSPMDGTLMLQKYNLSNEHTFSDPDCKLYHAFGLQRGTFWQLFAPGVISRGVRAMLHGHGFGRPSGDGFRMPGAFVLVDGRIVAEHRARSADDLPNVLKLLDEFARHEMKSNYGSNSVEAQRTFGESNSFLARHIS